MAHFITTRRVQFAETDMAGIVHFANFYRWMEETEHEFFRSRGLAIMHPHSDGRYIGWPRVSASCSFERPARYEDVIEVRLEIERIGVKSLTFLAEFWLGDQRIAHGRMKTACCLCGHGQPLESIVIPEEYLARFPAVAETPSKRSGET
jgi:YbgC/YbaW family acyl-CoA thioester hydrolase